MLLKIYLTAVVAGVLYPVLDSFMYRTFKFYREVGDIKSFQIKSYDLAISSNIKVYREGPIHYKILAALIPVFNFIFVISILAMIWTVACEGIHVIKKKLIWYMAKSVKHFLIKVWIVKHIFPAYVKYFYNCIEKRYADPLMKALTTILKAASKKEPEQKGEINEQK